MTETFKLRNTSTFWSVPDYQKRFDDNCMGGEMVKKKHHIILKKIYKILILIFITWKLNKKDIMHDKQQVLQN